MIQPGFPLLTVNSPDYQKEHQRLIWALQIHQCLKLFCFHWIDLIQSEGFRKEVFPCVHQQVKEWAGKVQLQLWPCGQARNAPVIFHLLPGNGKCRLSRQHFLQRGFNPGTLGSKPWSSQPQAVMNNCHSTAQAHRGTEDRAAPSSGQEKSRRQSRNSWTHQVQWTKAMMFKSERRKQMWQDAGQRMPAATSGNCPVPGPFPAARTGNAPGTPLLQEGNWNLGFNFSKLPHTTLEHNKFNFPHASGEFLHIGMQHEKTNSDYWVLMVKAKADSEITWREEKREQHHAKIASPVRTCSSATSFILSPLQSEFMVTPTLKSVNHKSTQDPALPQTKAQRAQHGWQVLLFFIYSATS